MTIPSALLCSDRSTVRLLLSWVCGFALPACMRVVAPVTAESSALGVAPIAYWSKRSALTIAACLLAAPHDVQANESAVATGQFGAAEAIEISVAGDDAVSFKLDNYLIPLSAINVAGLTNTLGGQKARMSGLFSKYAWTGVRWAPPRPFSNKHILRFDVAERLTVNDV